MLFINGNVTITGLKTNEKDCRAIAQEIYDTLLSKYIRTL